MKEKFRFDKKLGIDKNHISIGFVVVIVGILLFISYEVISRSSLYISMMKDFLSVLLNVLTPIIAAFIAAYLLYDPVIFIEIKLQKLFKIKTEKYFKLLRILSVSLLFIIIIALFSLIITFIFPPLIENAQGLISSIPHYETKIMALVTNLNDYFNSLNLDYNTIKPIIDKLGVLTSNFSQSLVIYITNFISGFSSFIVDFILATILTFYFLKDKELLFTGFNKFSRAFTPGKFGFLIKTFLNDLDTVVGGFVKGVLLDAVIVGFISSMLMLLIGHPFAILVGVIAGIANIIPYVGPAIGALASLFLGSFTSMKLGILGFILLILYQQIDGNIVQPKIVGDKVGLAPVWTLIALTIGGAYYGVIGMIISVPIAALIALYLNKFYKFRLGE